MPNSDAELPLGRAWVEPSAGESEEEAIERSLERVRGGSRARFGNLVKKEGNYRLRVRRTDKVG